MKAPMRQARAKTCGWLPRVCCSYQHARFSSASAQGQFDARCSIVGQQHPARHYSPGVAQIGASDYSANAVGRASGIFRMLLNGEGTVSVKGIAKDGWHAICELHVRLHTRYESRRA